MVIVSFITLFMGELSCGFKTIWKGYLVESPFLGILLKVWTMYGSSGGYFWGNFVDFQFYSDWIYSWSFWDSSRDLRLNLLSRFWCHFYETLTCLVPISKFSDFYPTNFLNQIKFCNFNLQKQIKKQKLLI